VVPLASIAGNVGPSNPSGKGLIHKPIENEHTVERPDGASVVRFFDLSGGHVAVMVEA
jgi:hypothetical protein